MPTKKPKLINWPDALDLFETALRAKRSSERTVTEYMAELRHAADVLSRLGTTPTSTTTAALRSFQVGLTSGATSRSGKPLCTGSVAKVSTVVRTFFAFLRDEQLIEDDPAARLELPTIQRRVVGDTLTVNEVKKLLRAASTVTEYGLRDRAAVEILFATGIRRAELVALDLEHIDHERREITVHGKGSKIRIVPLTRSAYGALMDYLERARPVLTRKLTSSALFLSRNGWRLRRTGLAKILTDLARWAGIKKRITPHTMRRTFATALLEGGASLRHIQLLLGHSCLETTAAYLRVDASDMRREVLLHHPRERFEV